MLADLLIILALVAVNGVFALSEMAVVSARRHRLQQMAKSGPGQKAAAMALALADNPSRFLSTVQIGITLVGIVAGAYGGASLAAPLGGWLDESLNIAPYGYELAFTLVVFLIGVLSLIFGELVPKRLALVHAEAIALATAPLMTGLAVAAAPLVWTLGAVTDAILKLLGATQNNRPQVTEEEVKTLIAEGAEKGVFDPVEQRMIEGVMRLPDRSVRSIMTPRLDMTWLDIGAAQDEILAEIAGSPHSRFPVCRGAADELAGMVSAKTLLEQVLTLGRLDLEAAMTPPLVVHDGTPLLRLLELFRSAPMPMAVVVDEYGSVEGVVTITDALQVIAGSFGENGEAEEANLARRDDGSWLVDGMTSLDEVEQATGVSGLTDAGEEGGFHTIAGFLLHRIGRVPATAQSIVWRGHRFEVVDMDGRRIDKVLISPEARAR
jgi:putative hemolysin